MKVPFFKLNSDKVSAQHRVRLFWTNIGATLGEDERWIPGIKEPDDKGILLKDIIVDGSVDRDKSYCILTNGGTTTYDRYYTKRFGQIVYIKSDRIVRTNEKYIQYDINMKGHNSMTQRIYFIDNKAPTLNSSNVAKILQAKEKDQVGYRNLIPIECERLQTFPEGYTELGIDDNGKEIVISKTQRFKQMGNSWTVDIITHIFNHIDNKWRTNESKS